MFEQNKKKINFNNRHVKRFYSSMHSILQLPNTIYLREITLVFVMN